DRTAVGSGLVPGPGTIGADSARTHCSVFADLVGQARNPGPAHTTGYGRNGHRPARHRPAAAAGAFANWIRPHVTTEATSRQSAGVTKSAGVDDSVGASGTSAVRPAAGPILRRSIPRAPLVHERGPRLLAGIRPLPDRARQTCTG